MTGHHGLLLAAGSGTRMGKPKALMRDADETSWLRRTVTVLQDGGCDPVTVVLGAGAGEATAILTGSGVSVVIAEDFAEGMGASLRAGVRAISSSEAVAAVVMLVDLPDVTAEVIRHVAARVTRTGQLARATYAGRPGHPVVIGRDHWASVADSVSGDQGARDYLTSHDVVDVECDHLATGLDRDSPIRNGPSEGSEGTFS